MDCQRYHFKHLTNQTGTNPPAPSARSREAAQPSAIATSSLHTRGSSCLLYVLLTGQTFLQHIIFPSIVSSPREAPHTQPCQTQSNRKSGHYINTTGHTALCHLAFIVVPNRRQSMRLTIFNQLLLPMSENPS